MYEYYHYCSTRARGDFLERACRSALSSLLIHGFATQLLRVLILYCCRHHEYVFGSSEFEADCYLLLCTWYSTTRWFCEEGHERPNEQQRYTATKKLSIIIAAGRRSSSSHRHLCPVSSQNHFLREQTRLANLRCPCFKRPNK